MPFLLLYTETQETKIKEKDFRPYLSCSVRKKTKEYIYSSRAVISKPGRKTRKMEESQISSSQPIPKSASWLEPTDMRLLLLPAPHYNHLLPLLLKNNNFLHFKKQKKMKLGGGGGCWCERECYESEGTSKGGEWHRVGRLLLGIFSNFCKHPLQVREDLGDFVARGIKKIVSRKKKWGRKGKDV